MTGSDIDSRRATIDVALRAAIAPGVVDVPVSLFDAMSHPMAAGGKRVRPLLLLSAGVALGADENFLMPFAVAVEFVHTYSLVHDDLPAMDDDDFRRGRPTCHKVHGEARAILAGDALLTEAFRMIAESDAASRFPDRAVRAIALLSRKAGAEGMVGGQALDLLAELGAMPAGGPEEISRRKTAALMAASTGVGGIVAGGTDAQVLALTRFGGALGLMFQIVDDLLDETGTFEEMGKDVGKDRTRGKKTYPSLHGIEAARRRVDELAAEAVASLSIFGPAADELRGFASTLAGRRS